MNFLFICRELLNREVLDSYLARALGIKMRKNANRLKDIDERKYVLTVDYALKMLDIHERYQCGIPVIIEGETGVGKTALVDMLSALWNRPWLDAWECSKECITEKITELITGKLCDFCVTASLTLPCVCYFSYAASFTAGAQSHMESSEKTQVLDAHHSITSGNVSLEALKTVGNVSMKDGGKVYLKLQPEIESLRHDPLLIMLDCNPNSMPCLPNTMESNSLEKLFDNSPIDCEVCTYFHVCM